jgi:hypothetical protein
MHGEKGGGAAGPYLVARMDWLSRVALAEMGRGIGGAGRRCARHTLLRRPP